MLSVLLLTGLVLFYFFFFFQAEDGIRDPLVTGVQTCALPIWGHGRGMTAVLIAEFPPAVSVHASNSSRPRRAIRALPLARSRLMPATVWLGFRRPDESMRRTFNSARPSTNSTHIAAAPSSSIAIATRPSELPSSSRTGAPNVRPPPPENAANACP